MKRRHPENRLLAALPRKDYQRLSTSFDCVELRFSEVLCKPGDRIQHVYFPAGSFVSVAAPVNRQASMEVGLIGNEGILGIPLILGIDLSPLRATVCGAGSALRMDTASFRRELGRSLPLQQCLNRYLYALMAQFAQAVACTRFHVLEERLARWLLMTHDRAHSKTFHLTHDFLADMLGVRREGVTKAAGSLQRNKVITYSRGRLTILDRGRLEAASCHCYEVMKGIYDDILRDRARRIG